MENREMTFWQRWMPAIVMCTVVLLAMIANYATVDRMSYYTLVMVGGCLLIMPLALY